MHFLIDAVDRLPAEDFHFNRRGPDGLSIPDEIVRREERYEKERRQKQAEYEEKKAAHEQNVKTESRTARNPGRLPQNRREAGSTTAPILKAGS